MERLYTRHASRLIGWLVLSLDVEKENRILCIGWGVSGFSILVRNCNTNIFRQPNLHYQEISRIIIGRVFPLPSPSLFSGGLLRVLG